MAGTMVWTLNDYYGEARQGWPGVSATYGAFDLAGFEKGTAWWYRAWWRDAAGAAPAAEPHWPRSAPVCQVWGDRWDDGVAPGGKQASVNVVTAQASAELFLDGESQGAQHPKPLGTVGWKASYSAGSNLTVVCRDAANRTVAAQTLVAPGPAAALRLSVDAPSPSTGTGDAVLLDGHDAALLRAELVDAKGEPVRGNTSHNVTFAVASGPGRIAASHNGDPSEHSPNLAPWHLAHYGLARGVLRVTADATPAAARLTHIDVDGGVSTALWTAAAAAEAASITVTASSPGLAPATVVLRVSADPADAVLAVAAREGGGDGKKSG